MLNQLTTLSHIIFSIPSKKELSDFLEGLLSPKEILELSKRIEIIRLLKQGVSHRQIADTLGVGVATVSRGAKELHRGKFDYV